MPLTVTIGPLPSLPDLRARWVALENRAAPSFFKTWAWIGSWLEAAVLPELGPGNVRLLCVLEDGAQVGLAVLCPVALRRIWRLPTNGVLMAESGRDIIDSLTVEYNGILAARGREIEITAAAAEAMLNPANDVSWSIGCFNRVSEIDFDGIRRAGVAWRIRHIDRCPLIASDGAADLETYLDQLGTNTRHQVRRSAKLLGGESLRVSVAAAADVERTLGEIGELHRADWTNRRRRSNAFGNPLFDRFASAICRAEGSAGSVELIKIAAGTDTVGVLMNFRVGSDMYAYQSGFKVFDDNRLKPGLVCHALAAVDATRRGIRAYHFMAGESRYKTSLGNAEEKLYSIEIGRRGATWGLETILLDLRARISSLFHYH